MYDDASFKTYSYTAGEYMGLLSLNSYNGLLEKCEYDYQMLESARRNPDYEYHVFNLVMGLNHLFEWYLKESCNSAQKKMECITRFNPFSSLDNVSGEFKSIYSKFPTFPRINVEQETIRKLCNNAKHFNSSVPHKASKHHTAVMGKKGVCLGNKSAMCGAFSHLEYTVSLGDQEINVVTLLAKLLEQWKLFVAETA